MMSTRPLFAVAALVAGAAALNARGQTPDGKDIDPTMFMTEDEKEEDFKKARELRHVMICKGCEDVADAAEQLIKDDWMKGKSKQQKAVAIIEWMDEFCASEEQAKNRLNCENGIEHLDRKDALTKYLQKGEVDEDFKEKKCKKLCTWKQDMKDQISGMQQGMIDRMKSEKEGELQEEIAKIRAEARLNETYRRGNLTAMEAFEEDMSHALADVAENWVMVIGASVLLVFVMTFVQVCWGVRKELKKRREMGMHAHRKKTK
eukprot:TRINITY_DN5010_c0_g1_i1.p2 TRINITY_DN5010_c0_g1~~TRINITY_DN5010_c0_g1_i1.p2  ORF type:complete len:261 (+),score=148.87 TRINITY_DN5010_c0_g1_i1:72-854(+)